MRLQSLTLRSFRSYPELALDLSGASSEILIGDNGSGKTNIVEAISLLSQGRSCLKADFQDMLRFGTDFFRVRADTESDAGDVRSVECVFQISPRKASAFFVQDVRTPLLSFIGTLPSITFLPQDLDLFTGAPSGRRGFLDALLCQLTPDFASLRLEYERILKQRNALLRRIGAGESPASDLDIWDDQLAASGTSVRERRARVLTKIAELLPAELARLGEEFSTLTIEVTAGTGDLLSDLRAGRPKDLILQTTTNGPHRDDWKILADGHSIGPFLSRGQQRAALLALLFVSAALFSTIRKEKPVILLDDVLSELDEGHQKALLKHLKDHQVFLTTTHPIPQVTGLRTWDVREGSVTVA